MRGNFGKPGAGICPLRGHSNVQGDRTVGITEKPDDAMFARIETTFGFRPAALGSDGTGLAYPIWQSGIHSTHWPAGRRCVFGARCAKAHDAA